MLEDQDRSRWDRAEIEEGCALVHAALARARPGTYALEAAIAAVHAEAASADATDWPQIAGLYARLLELHPSPVVALNRAVAVAMADGYEAGLALIDALSHSLDGYHLWHAARADLQRRLGRRKEAVIELPAGLCPRAQRLRIALSSAALGRAGRARARVKSAQRLPR